MYGATARQRPVKESLDNGKRSREHHLTARHLPSPSLDPKPTRISYSCHPSSSQLSLNYSSGNLATWNRRPDTQDSQSCRSLESGAQSRLSSGTATPSPPSQPGLAASASALTQFAEHVESDRGEVGRHIPLQGDPCLSPPHHSSLEQRHAGR